MTKQIADILLLSAGFGTRLRPLTLKTPKPLLPFCGKTVIERHLEILAKHGFRRVFINLHYLSEKIKTHLGTGSKWDLDIAYIEEETILDTGGAIKNIEKLLKTDYLITINSDIVLDPSFDLCDFFLKFTEKRKNHPKTSVMLMLVPCDKLNAKIWVTKNETVVGILDRVKRSEAPIYGYEYSGIQILSKDIFKYMPQAGTPFSITRDLYTKLIDEDDSGLSVSSLIYSGFWADIGSYERLKESELEFSSRFHQYAKIPS